MKKMLSAILSVLIALVSTAYGSPEDIRVTFGTNSAGYIVKARVNGVEIPDFNVKPPYTSHGVQLYHLNHKIKDKLPREQKHLLCLREGRNVIEIEFKAVGNDHKNDLKINFWMNSVAYDKNIFYFEASGNKSGKIKSEFYVYDTMPQGYQTLILKSQD